jgi:hypothetical protein
MERSLDVLAPFLSVETLTILQLVGFNFKRALGEPLTMLLQKFITSKVPADPQTLQEFNRSVMTLTTDLAKVAQDPDATGRLLELKRTWLGEQ